MANLNIQDKVFQNSDTITRELIDGPTGDFTPLEFRSGGLFDIGYKVTGTIASGDILIKAKEYKSDTYATVATISVVGNSDYVSADDNNYFIIEPSSLVGSDIKVEVILKKKIVNVVENISSNRFDSKDVDNAFGFRLDGNGDPSVADETYNTTGFLLVSEGQDYVHGHDGILDIMRWVYAFDDNKVKIAGGQDVGRTVYTIPAGASYIRVTYESQYFNKYQINLNSIQPYSVYFDDYTSLPDGVELQNDSLDFVKVAFKRSINLLNLSDDDYAPNEYLSDDNGNLSTSGSYNTSGFIDLENVDIGRYVIVGNDGIQVNGRHILFFDKDKVSIGSRVQYSDNAEIPKYARYVRVTVYSSNQKSQINLDYVCGYSVYKEIIYNELVPDCNPLLNSITGQQAKIGNSSSLVAGNTLEFSDSPRYINKGLCMSFYAELTLSGTVSFGKGYQQYRGDWLEIDGTNIYWKRYESSETTEATEPHGLTIGTFIKCSFDIDDNGICNVTLNSIDGTYETTFDWSYYANYNPFIMTVGQDLTNLRLSTTNKDLQRPVWAFGDSYFGIKFNDRWPYYIKQFGYFNLMINALAGQSSSGAYTDLLKCLKYGTPKYLFWCLGMNDADTATYETTLNKVINICESKGIILILATIPTTPTRDKEGIETLVESSGYRYVDFYKAVGTDSGGNWYSGYLDVDNVHPTALGAETLATQVLVDFPEMMQY